MKIIHLGVNKTGTKSLHESLEILGYKSCHWRITDDEKSMVTIRKIINQNIKNDKNVLHSLDRFDAITDFQCTMDLAKMIDDQYPGCKFIFTERNIPDWIMSRINHVKRGNGLDRIDPIKESDTLKIKQIMNPDDSWINIDIVSWISNFYKYKSEVLSYFWGRNNDLLVMDICGGDGWNKLCNFLKCEIPNDDFPHKNKTRWNK